MINHQLALVKREIWEHRSIYMTPAVIASIVTLGVLAMLAFASGFAAELDVAIFGAQNLAGEPERKAVLTVLNSEEAKGFDVIVAGHTDDMPVSKPETRLKHPTNWHLSAHRGISVVDLMISDGVIPNRLSVRGFGEFRPVEPNKPDKKGNAKNRRVEIFIVAKGM